MAELVNESEKKQQKYIKKSVYLLKKSNLAKKLEFSYNFERHRCEDDRVFEGCKSQKENGL